MKEKTYSLCLGGGAARGYMHIGVYRYIIENDIKIHDITGTSMGAIVGAGIALGMDYDTMYKYGKELGNTSNIITGLHFGKGMISNKKIMSIMEKIFGDKTFADTKIPLKMVATDLMKGSKKVFTEGSLAFASRASSSIPAIFYPAYDAENDKYYVDGCYVANLPVEENESDEVLAVSCTIADRDIKLSTRDVLHKTVTIGLFTNEEQSIALSGKKVHLIRPKLPVKFYDFGKIDMAIEVGYEAAKHYFENNLDSNT